MTWSRILVSSVILVCAPLLPAPAAAQEAPAAPPSALAQPATVPPDPVDPAASTTPGAAPPAPAEPSPLGETSAAGGAAAEPATDPTDAGVPGSPPPGAEPVEAQRGVTGVCGTVVDGATQEPLIDAPVTVVRGGTALARTDVDGRFELRLAPGIYDLRVRYELYQARRINGVAVVAGECTPVSLVLAAEAGTVEEVVVTARPDTRREAAVLAERKKAPVVQDAISAQEISRTPDSDASDAVKRVVSATVVDDKYVYLRGLGGRYSTVLVNGVGLPSPDPDEYAVPLDLFPTSLLSNLNVVKTYSAELPGGFAGGTLEIETTPYPADFEAAVKLSVFGDTQSTFQTRRTYDGGSLDFLTFDDGTRALPDIVPRDRPMREDFVTSEFLVPATLSFNDEWSTKTAEALPNAGFEATVGDTTVVGGRKLGWLASVDYAVAQKARPSEVTKIDVDGPKESFENEQGTLAANLSGLVNLGLELDRGSDLALLALYTRSSDSDAIRAFGLSEERGQLVERSTLQFVARGMFFTQLRGDHRMGEAVDLSWQGNFSWVDRYEPDTRNVTYEEISEGSGIFAFSTREGSSGERFFSDLSDLSGGGGLDLTVPFGSVRVRAGGAAQLSSRSYESRRFRFETLPTDPSVAVLPPEILFDEPYVDTNFALREATAWSDAYEATQGVYGGYAAVDAPLLRVVRLVAGLRYEHHTLDLTAGSEFQVTDPQPGEDRAERSESALLPSANVVVAISPDANVRAGYSYTLSRPQFRELAPAVFVDWVRRRNITGNPDLETTRIHNADLRWEWFPGESEVLAASAFYKSFRDPIELVIVGAQAGDLKYLNAGDAWAYGLEMEGRLRVGRFAGALRDFRAAANLALVRSEVDFGADRGTQTSAQRPLQGQSPYVVNASLGWARGGTEVTLLYNVYGERVVESGNDRLPDVYEQPFHRLDISASHRWQGWRAKLSLANLLDSSVVLTQGDFEVLRTKRGVAGSISLEWSR